eukprot:CAMPEP_0175447560 /NCGR_PEP_ID=MMETSP0095-20121207/60872_1 /TAXON_ID=311494 /ORGANISM="Alexandrium monilatum, Strain CCMP3105" /LENGTH=62 /DNA_ID=CAMNT_0016747915 /DNA_START=63 /DNA_END=247 /DNA_ORIENTATION=+
MARHAAPTPGTERAFAKQCRASSWLNPQASSMPRSIHLCACAAAAAAAAATAPSAPACTSAS